MATNQRIKINVEQISKHKLYKGNKGTYLDAVVIVYDEPDQFGYNGLIIEEISEQERKEGKKGKVLGNMRFIQKKNKPENLTELHEIIYRENREPDLPF